MRLASILTAIAMAATITRPGAAAPPVAFETHVLLRVEALTIENGSTKTAATGNETEIGPAKPGTIDLIVPWGESPGSVTLHLVVGLAAPTPDGESVLHLASSVARPGRSPVAASRELSLSDGGSGLFEVYGEGERRLLLTVHSESVLRAVVRRWAEMGAPVRFVLAVLRVDGERTGLLETNELNTFVGQSVEYSFRRGEGDGMETVRLNLTPVVVSGGVLTIDAEIDGVLPGAAGTALVSHRERIVASRNATSRLSATTGTPPAGYQFQVTPDF